MKRGSSLQITGGQKRIKKEDHRADDEFSILNEIELHPLLLQSNEVKDTSKGTENRQRKPQVKTPQFNYQTVETQRQYGVNPYYNPSTEILGVSKPRNVLDLKKNGNQKRDFQGERELLSNQAKQYQERVEIEEKEAIEWERREQLGLIVDPKKGEDKWAPTKPDWIEWWDEPLLNVNRYDRVFDEEGGLIKGSVKFEDPNDEDNPITIYIQHPVPSNTPWNQKGDIDQKVYLTKKELKRLRRNKRLIKREEDQDKIKLGLEPPPPPKIKLKNLMNVLTNESIQNPTALEMRVRNEMEERKRLHEEANLERKASKEQRNEKRKRDSTNDLNRGIWRSVYIIDKLTCGKNKYKVDMNAKQLNLTGVCCINKEGGVYMDKSIIIVEGGQKSIKRYRALLMRRINWELNERSKGALIDSPLQDLTGNKCTMIWEGEIQQCEFNKWTLYEYQSEESLLQFLKRHSMENYYAFSQ